MLYSFETLWLMDKADSPNVLKSICEIALKLEKQSTSVKNKLIQRMLVRRRGY
mgnify:CR=1 FL=1